jgi:hypothetical protein
MQFKALSLFKHETVTFEEGKVYDLPAEMDGLVTYFCKNGWAEAEGVQADPVLTSDHVLEVQDAVSVTTAE